MIDVAMSLGRRLELPLNYPAVGWKELVSIQSPKERAWARDERALDLLTKCLEVKSALTLCVICIRNSWIQIDPSKRITAKEALAHSYLTGESSASCVLMTPSP